MTASLIAATLPSAGHIRPLNMLRDLPAVADLIELCFSSTLDSEGRSYIDQMRRNGRDSGFINWAPRVLETISLPLSGYVWEYKGRVVGNVSLIPFHQQGKKLFLIANVATHPEFRRQGIARELTAAALKKARENRANAVWLHVRDDNQGAIQLYNELGFVARAQRTTWSMASGISVVDKGLMGSIKISPRPARDWQIQREWLYKAYPPDLEWYHSQPWNVFQPGLMNAFYRFMADMHTVQWSAYRNGRLQAVFSCLQIIGRADRLWVAVPQEPDTELVTALLRYGMGSLMRSNNNLSFEYPSAIMDNAICAAGMTAQRTLIWMMASGVATSQPFSRKSI